jgi:PBP1b-binding outer membrane lipoprotein LpoB
MFMKKLISLLLVLVLAMGIVGCSSDSDCRKQ